MRLSTSTQKILIVNDIPSDTKALNEALKNSNYEILIATTKATALQIAISQQPELILLDTIMQEIDGYTICTELKKDIATKNIPVIFLATIEDKENGTEGFKVGGLDYILKPICAPLVKARVRNYLELKRQRDILENISAIDGLTGIPNRYHFNEVLEQEWRRAIRGIFQLSLIIIDVDYFRLFNENYGCAVGDDCLKQIAYALSHTTERATDLMARYEGDQFACILPLTDTKGAFVMANKLKSSILSLSIPHIYSITENYITISQGIATLRPYPNSEPTMLVADAKKALYEAKMNGRNQIKILD